MKLYSSLLSVPVDRMADWLWDGHRVEFGGSFQNYGLYYYPLLIGVAAVLLSRPGVTVRTRLAMLTIGLPLTLLVHVAMIVTTEALEGISISRSSNGYSEGTADALAFLGYAIHVGLLLTMWVRWHAAPQLAAERPAAREQTGEG